MHPIDCGGVLLPETTRPLRHESWLKSIALLVVVAAVLAMLGTRLPDSLRGTDFPDFYCAARMLLDGHGHQLYDADLQRQYQARYSGRVGTLYIHPPFEAVLYLVVAWLPLRRAYVLWSVLNLVLLTAAVRRLVKQALPLWDWRILLAASLTFVPLLLCLIQGQDSLLLLLLVILAFTDLRLGRATASGCWLGLGLFKFHFVLPLILVLALTQDTDTRRALTKAFTSVALVLAGLSAVISEWSVFRVYPDFLLHLQEHRFAGIFPQAMANFRGLIYVVFYHDHSAWAAIAGLSILSAAALIKILFDWKHTRRVSGQNVAIESQSNFDLAFANTVLFSLLVSYHSNPHDLSLLVLPMAVMLHAALGRRPSLAYLGNRTILLLLILFLPPLHVWALKAGVYALVAVPIVFLFLTSGSVARQANARRSKAPHPTVYIENNEREDQQRQGKRRIEGPRPAVERPRPRPQQICSAQR
jgi:glycosyl transferase family 87